MRYLTCKSYGFIYSLMAESTYKILRTQASQLIRQLSGSARAIETAAHTALHLGNVERWAQGEFNFQRQAHEQRLASLEHRVLKLEKVTKALQSAGKPESCPESCDAHEVVSIAPSYFNTWQNLIAQIDRQQSLFVDNPSVLELGCGAAKCCSYLRGRVEQYVGVEPSDVLLEAARRRIGDTNFSFLGIKNIGSIVLQADLVLLFAEKHRWSVHDLETLLGIAEAHLAKQGRILLHIPYKFSDLDDAGWQLSTRLAALGLESCVEEQITEQGSYVIISRRQNV